MRAWVWLVAGVLGVGTVAAAGQQAGMVVSVGSVGEQQPVKAPVGLTGTVVGLVTGSDTQRPARFAKVALLLKRGLEVQPDYSQRAGRPDAPAVVMLQGSTGADGRYAIAEVPVGNYYAIGVMEGYRLPEIHVRKNADAADLEKVMAGYPLVHVSANGMTVANVVMPRGAGVSGRVVFDDGSPGAGFRVELEEVAGTDGKQVSQRLNLLRSVGGWNGGGARGDTMTNDRGEFRIAGVAPGKYRVGTVMSIGEGMKFVGTANSVSGLGNGNQQNITIYAPGKFHKDEGQVVEVRGDEEDTGVDVRVSLDATHTVSGTVLAKEDRHVPGHAFLALSDVKDKGLGFYTQLGANGEYHFSYVPEGTYTLTVQGAYDGADPTSAEEARVFKPSAMYAGTKVDVVVTDHDVVVEGVLLDKVKTGDGPED